VLDHQLEAADEHTSLSQQGSFRDHRVQLLTVQFS